MKKAYKTNTSFPARPRTWAFFLLVATLELWMADLVEADELSLRPYLGENRILLVFGPADEPRRVQQREILETDAAGLEERHLVVLHPTEGGRLAERFEVGPSDFAVILIGKDGGEKLRRHQPVALAELFALIDSMPMRRREIRLQKLNHK